MVSVVPLRGGISGAFLSLPPATPELLAAPSTSAAAAKSDSGTMRRIMGELLGEIRCCRDSHSNMKKARMQQFVYRFTHHLRPRERETVNKKPTDRCPWACKFTILKRHSFWPPSLLK